MSEPTPLDLCYELLELQKHHPTGTHFCVLKQEPGYSLNIEALNSLCQAFIAQADELKSAREVIEFYGNRASWFRLDHSVSEVIHTCDSEDGCGGILAREFLAKWEGDV